MKKIMFNDECQLTKAVLELRKTMTRRACKDIASKELILAKDVFSMRYYQDENLVEFVMNDGSIKVSKPMYKVGEIVAVAQSYKDLKLSYIPHIDEPDFKTCTKHAPQWGNPRGMKGWSNKMFVRPDIMPHQIKITDIRVERLQDTSDEDALKEDIYGEDVLDTELEMCFAFTFYPALRHYDTPKMAYAALIDKVSGKGTWESNPYAVAYSFKLVK